jgi:hypothetical protein
MADNQFLESTQFIEQPFEIYDSMLAEFIDLPPLSEWKHPSWKYSFFLLKAKELSEAQCLDIGEWIEILDTDIMECLTKAPILELRPDSPLPPSHPPSPLPSPRLIQYTDRGTSPFPKEVKIAQYVEYGTQTGKRKRFDIEAVHAGPSKAPGVNHNLNAVPREKQDEERKVKRARGNQKVMVATIFHGTGTRSDPIIVND